jgi:hypothetical protein
MTNLLKETKEELEEHKLSGSDVLWVGSKDLYTTWDNFIEIANVEYDSGFGVQGVIFDLLIVGKDWWLERHEYDGSEWWEFKRLPIKPNRKQRITGVLRINYEGNLKELNKLGDNQ